MISNTNTYCKFYLHWILWIHTIAIVLTIVTNGQTFEAKVYILLNKPNEFITLIKCQLIRASVLQMFGYLHLKDSLNLS